MVDVLLLLLNDPDVVQVIAIAGGSLLLALVITAALYVSVHRLL